jgi:hypothetical protein
MKGSRRLTTFYRENAPVGEGFVLPPEGGRKARPYTLVRLGRVHKWGFPSPRSGAFTRTSRLVLGQAICNTQSSNLQERLWMKISSRI